MVFQYGLEPVINRFRIHNVNFFSCLVEGSTSVSYDPWIPIIKKAIGHSFHHYNEVRFYNNKDDNIHKSEAFKSEG